MTTSKTTKTALVAAFATFVLAALSAPASAADKTYQVTGPVLEVSDSSITVQKGKEKWQLARTKDTKVTGDLAVGAKVTIMYTMTAVSVEAKADPKAAKPADATKPAEAAKPAAPAAPAAAPAKAAK